MLQHPQFSIPIEAKINAGDQESQCYDYHFYARNAKLVYLTKDDKTKPSPWTMQSRDKGNTLEESAVKSYYVKGGFCHQIHMTAAHLW